MSDRDRINERVILVAHDDPEGQWAVHYMNDGLHLIRPAARLWIPYEMCKTIAEALTKGAWKNDESLQDDRRATPAANSRARAPG